MLEQELLRIEQRPANVLQPLQPVRLGLDVGHGLLDFHRPGRAAQRGQVQFADDLLVGLARGRQLAEAVVAVAELAVDQRRAGQPQLGTRASVSFTTLVDQITLPLAASRQNTSPQRLRV